MSSFIHRRAALAAAVALSLSAFNADAQSSSLDRVVVTGTRTAQTQDQSLASMTVFDRSEIERLQVGSLFELLRGVPGVSLANNGGAGQVSAVFLRGAESRHVLVLVDGVRMGSATAGTFAFQDLPIEQIERIEIVRGPFSSLYGSDAIGGVIQIFTRRAQGEPSFNAYAGAGSYGLRRGGAGVNARGEQGWYSLQYAHEDTDGFDACRGRPFPNGAGCFTDEPDDDGYRNRSLQLAGGWKFSPRAELEARALRAEFDTEFDGSFTNEMEGAQQAVSALLKLRPSEAVQVSVRAGKSADLADNFLNGVYSSSFDTRRGHAGAQGDLAIGGGLLSVGFDWYHDEVTSTTAYEIDDRTQKALFAQWQQQFGAHAVQLAGRRDDDSQFGGETTGSLLYGFDFSDALRFTASAGTAFKAPSFNDLYFPGFGNPLLQPEVSESYELGLRGTPSWGAWALSAFRSEVDELVAFDPVLFIPVNLRSARIDGLEASAETRLAGFDLRASATWLDARDNEPGVADQRELPRRAPRSGQIDADRSFGRFSIGATVFGASGRFDDLGNLTRLKGYGTLDLRLAWQLNDALSLQLSGRNLFDRKYETAAFYNQPGRNWMLGLRYSPH
jgi:vitamin B12 transporter